MNKKADKLIYLPLGGAGEIGMNMYLYGYGPEGKMKFIMVDAGVAFPDMDTTPGVDLICADPTFIAERADRLEAIFITHGHEDHIGAIARLWPDLRAPVYARKFTAALTRKKFAEAGLDESLIIDCEAWPAMVEAGPFQVGFAPVSHSIPESSAMVIDTPKGRIFHTGDLKTDPEPGLGESHDPVMLSEIANDGVLALVCDSTNVFNSHVGRSEADVIGPITEFMKGATGMVVATTFASNIARLRTLALAGQAAGRGIVLLGRAMQRMVSTAQETGLLTDFPATIDVKDAADMPGEALLVLASGSQGERRAVSAQLARGSFMGLQMREHDSFLFSSKTIPGNEKAVAFIHNQLAKLGVDVFTDADGLFHVSGHANRPDLMSLHQIMKPAQIIPMHGEYRHLREHAKLAAENGFKAVVADNGTVVEITEDGPLKVDQIETGRRYFQGKVQYGWLDGIVRERLKIALSGIVIVSVILDENSQPIDGAWVEVQGLKTELHGEANALQKELEEAVDHAMARAKRRERDDDDALEGVISGAVRRRANAELGVKPVVNVLISRMELD